MDRQKRIEKPLIPLMLMMIGMKQICGDLLLAAVLGGGIYAAAVWIEQKIRKD
ncbi:MAG: hypothetical protein K2O40_14910 [Lachnospiraceae bacterium]|nr:hypothetical protein [Lachnospiraceae bacterium]